MTADHGLNANALTLLATRRSSTHRTRRRTKELGSMSLLTELASIGAQTWMDQAACRRTANPDHWFPEIGMNRDNHVARQICRDLCPVKTQCLQWAFDNDEAHGIYGGLTVGERERLRKKAA